MELENSGVRGRGCGSYVVEKDGNGHTQSRKNSTEFSCYRHPRDSPNLQLSCVRNPRGQPQMLTRSVERVFESRGQRHE